MALHPLSAQLELEFGDRCRFWNVTYAMHTKPEFTSINRHIRRSAGTRKKQDKPIKVKNT